MNKTPESQHVNTYIFKNLILFFSPNARARYNGRRKIIELKR